MKKIYFIGIICAIILAINYFTMHHAGNTILSTTTDLSVEPNTAILAEHEPIDNNFSSYTPVITGSEHKILEEIATKIRISTLNTATSNRQMSDNENSRRLALQRAYSRAIRLPEDKLPLQKIDGTVWFDTETLAYQYPNEEMSDEMLLELIDFDSKLNLLLAELAQADAPSILAGELTEEQAINHAKQAIFEFYSLDAALYDAYASLLELDQQHVWSISFFPPNEDLLSDTEKYYQVLAAEVDADTNELLSLDRTENKAHNKDVLPDILTQDEAASCEAAAKQALSLLTNIPEDLSFKGVLVSPNYSDLVFVILSDELDYTYRVALCWPNLEANGFSVYASHDNAVKNLTPLTFD